MIPRTLIHPGRHPRTGHSVQDVSGSKSPAGCLHLRPQPTRRPAPTEPPPHHAWTGHTVQDVCGSNQSMWPVGSPLLPQPPMRNPSTKVVYPYVPRVQDKSAAPIRAAQLRLGLNPMTPHQMLAILCRSQSPPFHHPTHAHLAQHHSHPSHLLCFASSRLPHFHLGFPFPP